MAIITADKALSVLNQVKLRAHTTKSTSNSKTSYNS